MADGPSGSDTDSADVRSLLAKIEKHLARLSLHEQRRYRELIPIYGVNHCNQRLQVGANQVPLLNWPYGGADNDCSPCLETVTIDVDWSFHDDPSSSAGAQAGLDSIDRAFLTVTWGTCDHRADFDLMMGTSVTVSGYKVLLAASYLQASAVTVDNELVQIPQPRLSVRASLSPGTKQYGGLVGNARRTIQIGAIGAGVASAKIQIPPWAKEIGIANTTIGVPTMTVDQFANANNAAPSIWTGTVGKGSVDTVERDSYANWLTVTNTSAAPVTAKVIFYLGR